MMTPDPFLVETTPAERDWSPMRFDVMAVVVRVIRRWYIIAACTVLAAVLSAIYAYRQKPYFDARATFLPPARDTTTVSGGTMAAFSLISSAIQGSTYQGFLRSRSVQDSVIQHLDLVKAFNVPNIEAARGVLEGSAGFDVDSTGVLNVTIRSSKPELSAKIANAYVDALYELNQRMTGAALAQRLSFYDQQVKQSRAALEEAEAAMEAYQEKNQILDTGSATQISISTQARLKGAIEGDEVQLRELLQSHTENSPEVIRLKTQMDALRSQLARETTIGTDARGIQARGALPRLNIQAVRLSREVRERESIYEALLHQSDVAHISEADPGPQFQVLDRAEVPLRKAGPSRMRYLIMGTLTGFGIGLLYVLAGEWAIATGSKVFQRIRAEV